MCTVDGHNMKLFGGDNSIPFVWIFHFLIESVQRKTTDKQLLEQA